MIHIFYNANNGFSGSVICFFFFVGIAPMAYGFPNGQEPCMGSIPPQTDHDSQFSASCHPSIFGARARIGKAHAVLLHHLGYHVLTELLVGLPL